MPSLYQAVLLAAAAVSTVLAVSPIEYSGSKMFVDGNQFFIKGMAYQLTDDDPLVDTNQCTLDADLMKTIGVNTIRVYHVNPYQDHDGCMSVFADAGIYLFVDMDTYNTSIYQANPYWDEIQFASFALVMDAFANYDNTAGYFVGNEAITSATGSLTAPYLKAATADMKAYRKFKNYRDFAIGYAAADIAELRPMLQNYLACGDDSSQAIDFFSLNSYEWCGTEATFNTSGYNNLNEQAQGYSVPIFFSETGCNVGGERTFADQSAILGPDMNDQWSGAIIYEWVQEVNSYGVISYGGSEYAGTPTPVQPDFSNLSQQWATLTPTGVASAQYTAQITPPACPASTEGGWLVDGDVSLPTLGMSVITASNHQLTTYSYASTSSPIAAATATSTLTSSGQESLTTSTATESASASATTTKSSGASGKEMAGAGGFALSVVLFFAMVFA